ncbi:valacyclovir hydrolase [Takifugu rubripes]|uniref:AB hydrolase-1 domain-containing protein n=1 Tax=Takifugu rubripes TaxID=31033 RepID=H2SCI9_TAKRU|nr:valacyclovir hydrolase [Takifugu rubripes]
MRTERKAAMTMTENIEMELFSSEESCAAIQTQEEQLRKPVNLHKCHKHPLVLDDEDEEDPELPVQTQTSPSPCKAQMELLTNEKLKPYSLVPGKMERTDIEMQMLPSNSKSVKASWKIAPLKWRRVLQNTGLVVKDVICLPGGYLDRQPVLRLRQRASPTVTSRITIDSDWSAVQMQNCLVLFFSRWFVQPAGQKLFFTFLQRVQGSSVLFVPETPSEGWTGGQVLQICERGPLYVLTHLDCKQAEPDKLVKKRMFCVDNATACCLDQVGQQTGEEVTLDSLLRLFRQENTDPDEKIYIRVKRDDLLHEVLKVVAAPTFSFRKTPIVSFVGEETDSSEPVREFFRLVLNGLRDSCVFEGLPGRLLLTYDLAALDLRLYYKAGVLIGWSLAHRGPGPQCLHPALYQLMCRKNPSLEDFSWSQIVGTEVQSRLQQLRSCADVRSLPPSLCHWLLSCGISEICLKQSDHIPAVYSSVVKHYIFHRVASMISQFKDGLNSCGGLWDMIESRWEMFCPVMTSVQQRPLSHQEFPQPLFNVCYSQSDGPLRAAEEATVRHWEAALEKVRDGQADFSFEDLLSFITGAGRLPLFGLSTLISLRFYSQLLQQRSCRIINGLQNFRAAGRKMASRLFGGFLKRRTDVQRSVAALRSQCSGGRQHVNGVDLHFELTGAGKHGVLLLPGALGSARTDFGPQLKSLSKETFTVVGWDPRGYGRSRPPDRDFPPDFFEQDAKDAMDLMKALGFSKFSLLGWSDGGITALIAAAKNPGKIRKLVVWGCNAFVSQQDMELYDAVRDVSKWSARMRQPMEEMYGAEVFAKLWEAWVDGISEYTHRPEGSICMELLPLISCPTLIIHGEKDPMVPNFHPQYLLKHIKGSRLHLMPEGKHNLHLRFADEFNRLVEHFLDE